MHPAHILSVCSACHSAWGCGGIRTGGSEARSARPRLPDSSGPALTTSTDPAQASIPFDRDRNGFVIGEGAGIDYWKRWNMQKREAHIYAELAGYGATAVMRSASTSPAEAVRRKQWSWQSGKADFPNETSVTSTHMVRVRITMICLRPVRSEMYSEHMPMI